VSCCAETASMARKVDMEHLLGEVPLVTSMRTRNSDSNIPQPTASSAVRQHYFLSGKKEC
jgi:hypothetical protein